MTTATPTTAGMTSALRRYHQQQAAESRSREARSHPNVLRASGVRIERMNPERLRAIAGQRQRWQPLAWGYRDMIGELRAALKFRAQAISRVRFYVAQIQPDDDEPVALSLRNEVGDDGKPTERAGKVTLPNDFCTMAEAELARLPLDSGDAFTGVMCENFDVAGECWLYGREDPDTGEEVWEIRSVDDVDIQGSDVTIKDELGQPRRINLDPDSGEELYRLWCPHPRHPHQADSALNACLDSLEDITLVAREMRAVSRSRIAVNGVALVPDGMAQLRNTKDDDERTPRERFMANFTAAIVAPISNEGDAGGIAPIVLTGNRDDIAAFKFIRLDREDSPVLIEKLNKALTRMAQSLDVPPEIVTGMADVNHWTAWQIDKSTFRYYLEPGIRLMADSLTQSFLRGALKGQPPEYVKQVRIWFDAGAITENPNRREDTLDALEKMLISPRTGRAQLGFGESDAPTDEEIVTMIAARNGFDQATAARILLAATRDQDIREIEATPAGSPDTGQRGLPPVGRAEPDATGVGGTGAPNAQPPGMVSSGVQVCDCGAFTVDGQCVLAHVHDQRMEAIRNTRSLAHNGITAAATSTADGWKLDSELGERLADVERALSEQILLAADEALNAALRKAGSRLRSKAQRDPALTASLRAHPVTEWGQRMGRDQAFALGADLRFLLKEAFTDLGEKFGNWTRLAIDKIVKRVVKFLGLTGRDAQAVDERMRSALQARIPAAWTVLHDALEKRAERLMFDGSGEPLVSGEQARLTVPVDSVRGALAILGGLPETAAGVDDTGRIPTGEALTGMADGTTVTGELEAHDVIPFGREWRYNPALLRDTFIPHYDLDGKRFTSWTDPVLLAPPEYAWVGEYFRPKDHRGCLCTSAVTYAIPTAQIPDEQPFGVDFYADVADYRHALAEQLRERLRQPSQSMAYIIELAETDDAAGRKFTTAQQTRDTWLAVQALKDRFLNGES